MSSIRAVVVVFLGLSFSSVALAQNREAEAREHFDRGVELLDEQRFEAALAELSRAYELAPSYPVLFNLGLVHASLGHPVESSEAFERYLREGGNNIPAERRAAVDDEMRRQRARIATVDVRVNVPGATILVDGADRFSAPLSAPIRLGAGPHTIGARAPGYETVQRAITVAGGDTQTLDIELRADVGQGVLRIRCDLPGVEVTVDGRLVGTTPIANTVPATPGSHQVLGRRQGYRSANVATTVVAGGETEVSLALEAERDIPPENVGALVLRLPEAQYRLRVDGQLFTARGGRIELPMGPHEIEVDVEDREPVRQQVEIAPQQPSEFAPELVWTPEARSERLAAAGSQRVTGWALLISGFVVAVPSASVLAWNETRLGALEPLDARIVECNGPPIMTCPDLPGPTGVIQQRDDLATSITIARIATIAGTVIGAGLLVTGIVLLGTAPDDGSIDAAARAPSARLRVGPSGLSVDGTF